jgi:hypothetical protein
MVADWLMVIVAISSIAAANTLMLKSKISAEVPTVCGINVGKELVAREPVFDEMGGRA